MSYKKTVFLLLLLIPTLYFGCMFLYIFMSTPDVIQKSMEISTSDVVYFGDSVIARNSREDIDKSSISEIMAMKTRKKQITLDGGSYSVILYSKITDVVKPASEIGIKMFIIPLNLRSFSEEWLDRPSYNFKKESLYFDFNRDKMGFFKHHEVFRKYIFSQALTKEMEAWKNSEIFRDNTTYKMNDILSSDNKVLKFNLYYMYSLQTNNRMLDYLKKCIMDIANKGHKSIVYITPIDVEFIRANFSPQKLRLIENNTSIISSFVSNLPCSFVDISTKHKLPSSDFLDDCEHLTFYGREFVASAISAFISEY